MKTINKNRKNHTSMKNAVVDQIVLWIVLFIIFISFLFFVIEYSNAIKVKDNTDAIADYTARMVALGKTEADIATSINDNIKDDYFNNVAGSGIVCVEDTTTSNYQVIVNIKTTMTNDFLTTSNVHSRTVVFNEISEFKKECDLTLTIK